MKQLIYILILFTIISCQRDSYKVIDKSSFLEWISTNEKKIKLDNLTFLYYYDYSGNPYPSMAKMHIKFTSEGNKKIASSIFKEYDDSISSIKIEIVFTEKDSVIKIIEIRKSFNCHKDRGHQYFNNEYCS